MRVLISIFAAWALAGCSTLPQPTEPVPGGNAQVRLSEIQGAVESGFAGATGSACVLSILGKVPAGVIASLDQGTCAARIVGQGD